MATRTAPVVTGATNALGYNGVITSLHLVDASGDQITVAVKDSASAIGTDIEAWAAAYQAVTKASLWQISQTLLWTGSIDPDNADIGQRNSVKDGVNLLFRNLTDLKSETPRLVAPVDAVMQGNQDIPLLTAGGFPALITSFLPLLVGYSLDSAQYTERRERNNNPRIKA